MTNTAVLALAAPVPDPDLHGMTRDVTHWFAVHWLQIVLAIGAGILVYLVLNLLRGAAKRLRDRPGDQLGITGIVGRVLARTSHFFMMMVAVRLVAGYANPPELLLVTIRFLFIVAAAFQVAIWLREIILGIIERRSDAEHGNETLVNAMGIIRLLVSVALFAVAAIVVLDNVGVNVSGLIAGLGIGGIAIGLAAQGIFSDLFAALSIIFDRPFRQGETIAYDQTSATVERIGLKSTRLRAITGEKKIISNTKLLEKEITSYDGLDHRRIRFALGLVYQLDVATMRGIPDLLKDIVEREGARFVRAGLVGFGASSVDFELEADVPSGDWDAVHATRSRVGLAILDAFNQRQIGFAYPTQTSFSAAPDGRLVMPYADPGGGDQSKAGA
jgi:small-conductance mechanosensitive channel